MNSGEPLELGPQPALPESAPADPEAGVCVLALLKKVRGRDLAAIDPTDAYHLARLRTGNLGFNVEFRCDFCSLQPTAQVRDERLWSRAGARSNECGAAPNAS